MLPSVSGASSTAMRSWLTSAISAASFRDTLSVKFPASTGAPATWGRDSQRAQDSHSHSALTAITGESMCSWATADRRRDSSQKLAAPQSRKD